MWHHFSSNNYPFGLRFWTVNLIYIGYHITAQIFYLFFCSRDIDLQIKEVPPRNRQKKKNRYKTNNISFKNKLMCDMIDLPCRNLWLKTQVKRIKTCWVIVSQEIHQFRQKSGPAAPPRGRGRTRFLLKSAKIAAHHNSMRFYPNDLTF